MPKDGKVVVSGINVHARHAKPTQARPQGGIIRAEAPLHVSKVAIEDPKTGKPTRVRFETRDGKKVRIAVAVRGADQWLKPNMSPRLRADYDERIVPAMIEKFGYKNRMEVPRLDKIVINMGVGEATQDKKKVETAAQEMELIAGQKPVITKAKKSIAQFKLREGMPIGVKVTLRRERMYEFLDRLVTIALPRVRDFRGLNPKSFDGRGNYAMGLKEQLVFPEINYDRIEKVRGMDIIVTTTAKTDDEARELLRLFNFPFPRAKKTQERGGLSHGETEFDQQERASQEAGEEICRPICEAEGDRERQVQGRDRAADRAAEDGRDPAQRQSDPRPQPLRADRAFARRLSQIPAVADHAAGNGQQGPDPRPHEVELVR